MIPGPNWARRYVTPSRRLCARPGCGSTAAATLRFQPTQREAWLVDLDDTGARTEGDLCARHASTLVLPRGWELHDQRTPASAIPAPNPPRHPPAKRSVARSRRRRALNDDSALPGLAAVPEHTVGPEPDAEAESAPVLSAEALTTPELEDLADTLDAQTPLLRRAFQNVWPLDDDGTVDGTVDDPPEPVEES